ncbi:hypothetical protein EIK77_007845 [Talaromyces pinophilus]|nr:hypothetical protein EIK77_007845 [Talaromyces pinophilus]
MAITGIQDTLNATRVVDCAVLVREATTVTTGLYGIVVSRASLPRLGSRELVGARVAAAREFADGGHDQGPDAGYGGGDDDDCVFDVAPAEELEATGGAEVGDAGDGGEFGGFDDGGDHGTKMMSILITQEWEAETYTRPKLSRTMRPILTRIFRLRFQKMSVGKTARNKSQAEFAPI